jgi:hypothetical protein
VDVEEIEVPPRLLAELGLQLEGLEFAEQPVVVVAAAAAAEVAAETSRWSSTLDWHRYWGYVEQLPMQEHCKQWMRPRETIYVTCPLPTPAPKSPDVTMVSAGVEFAPSS